MSRILSIDIETRPNLVYAWSLFGRDLRSGINPDMVVEPKRMMCFAAKWIGEQSEPEFYSLFHNGKYGMLDAAWGLLSMADALVYYNGDRFDEPQMNREFLISGYGPPSPFHKIDLYKTVRSRFSFPSGRLDYVAKELEVGRKVKHSGFDLWIRCMNDDPEAWEDMKTYNIQDTVLNEQVFNKLRPWITSNIPSIGAETGMDVCPDCGSRSLMKQGFRTTKTGRFQRYRCNDCGSWLTSTRRNAATTLVKEMR